MSKLSNFLSPESLSTLYYSLVHPHLLYALPVWASTYKTHLSKLKRLQNKAVRLIFRLPLSEKITPFYLKLNLLKLDDLYLFEISKIMYQHKHKMIPDHFTDYFCNTTKNHSHYTRHSSKDTVYLARYTSSRTQKSIKYVGAKVWNDIPLDIKRSSYVSFKKSYKKLLLNKYQ